MSRITDLPTETLKAILESLSETDLQSLLASQLVCKSFHNIIETILGQSVYKSTSDHITSTGKDLKINTLLYSKFKPLFNTGQSSNGDAKIKHLNPPFQKLAWAKTKAKREPFLRLDASWRKILVTAGTAPITHLEIVKVFTVYGGTSMTHYQVELPSSGLNMGTFYDLLLSPNATWGSNTSSWKLRVGSRLRNYEDWVALRRTSTYPSSESINGLFDDGGERTKQTATLYVNGGRGCVMRSYNNDKEDNEIWRPNIIGKSIKCVKLSESK